MFERLIDPLTANVSAAHVPVVAQTVSASLLVVPPRKVPQTSQELGEGMRALRSVGLRSLERNQHPGKTGIYGYTYRVRVSRSALSRYEGGVLPPLHLAAHLDQLYSADGWIDLGMRSLWRPHWDPWEQSDAWPQRMHFTRWPSRYSGLVWMKVVPASRSVDEDHTVILDWGPWHREVRLAHLSARGTLLITGKALDPDGISRTLNFACDKQVHVLFGAGDEGVDTEDVLDIRDGWMLARPER